MKRTSNRKARVLVDRLEEFKGSNTFAEYTADRKFYVVYSYGYHFPMYVYGMEYGKWYANKDGYSHSTAVHKRQLRPSAEIRAELTTQQLDDLISNTFEIVQ